MESIDNLPTDFTLLEDGHYQLTYNTGEVTGSLPVCHVTDNNTALNKRHTTGEVTGNVPAYRPDDNTALNNSHTAGEVTGSVPANHLDNNTALDDIRVELYDENHSDPTLSDDNETQSISNSSTQQGYEELKAKCSRSK